MSIMVLSRNFDPRRALLPSIINWSGIGPLFSDLLLISALLFTFTKIISPHWSNYQNFKWACPAVISRVPISLKHAECIGLEILFEDNFF